MDSAALCISEQSSCRQQRAVFLIEECICRLHCAVNGIKIRKIIRRLCLLQFAVQQLRRRNLEYLKFFRHFIIFQMLIAYQTFISA